MYMHRVDLGSTQGGSRPPPAAVFHPSPGSAQHNHTAILDTATGPTSFSCGHLT